MINAWTKKIHASFNLFLGWGKCDKFQDPRWPVELVISRTGTPEYERIIKLNEEEEASSAPQEVAEELIGQIEALLRLKHLRVSLAMTRAESEGGSFSKDLGSFHPSSSEEVEGIIRNLEAAFMELPLEIKKKISSSEKEDIRDYLSDSTIF